MKRMRIVAGVGLLAAAGLAGNCDGKDDELRAYLGDNGALFKWEIEITKAVCRIEGTITGIPSSDRYCPSGYPPSITPPPKYPPS